MQQTTEQFIVKHMSEQIEHFRPYRCFRGWRFVVEPLGE